MPWTRRGFLAATMVACARRWSFADKEVSWLAEAQRAPAKPPADAPRLSPLLVDDDGRPIADLAGWKAQRERLRGKWLEFLHPFKVARSGPPAFEVLEEDTIDGVRRQRIGYEVEPGVGTEAYLLRPAGKKDCPGLVALHPTVAASIREPAGLVGRPEAAFGLNLARQGWVSICPRNYLWPDNDHIDVKTEVPRFEQRHPGSKGMYKMLFDAIVATDILASLPEVDPQRLGAIGHSLGAKEVLYLAAFDERIRVAVSSEGGIGTRFSNWNDPWYLGKEIDRPGFPREHHELLALAAPRAFLLLGGDSADGDRSWPFLEATLPVYRLYGGAPRLGLTNHRKGHSIPIEVLPNVYNWLATYIEQAPRL